MNSLANKVTRLSNDFLMTILTIAVIISLLLVAIGSYNTARISKGFQRGVTTNFQLQQLNGKISHYDEILTMSARMAAATGDLAWQERYQAYEPLLMDAINNAIELAPEAYQPYAIEISTANIKLLNLENQAFKFVEQNQTTSALKILFSDAYKTQQEAYNNGFQEWSTGLSQAINKNLTDYQKGLSISSTFSMVSFWVLTIAWIMLLRLTNQYIQRRKIAENKLRKAKSQIESSHQELQVSEAALHQKAVALEAALLELQQTQVQIVQSEKMSSLGQLVAGIAHEINNPVNFIHANLDPIDEYTADILSLLSIYQTTYTEPTSEIAAQADAVDIEFVKSDMPKIIRSMKVGTERIRQIVLSLRNFSRSDEQGLKTIDIHEGLESTLLILQHRWKENSEHLPILIHRDYGKLPLVECYPGQLNQVFMNLLANAIDAIEDSQQEGTDNSRGSIRLSTSAFQQHNQKWIKVSIADSGLGIPETIQPRIFDAFYTTKAVGKGTGMGLSISHTIITKKHGGSLSYRTFEGKGTEFIIQIPIVAAPVETTNEIQKLETPKAAVFAT